MKSRNSTNNPTTAFTQRLLPCLSKLKDNSTIQTAHTQLLSLLSQTQLPVTISQLHHLDDNDNLPDKVKRQYVKVYGLICEAYGVALFDYFDRFIASLMKKVRFAAEVAEVLGAVAALLEGVEYGGQVKYVEAVLVRVLGLQNYASMGICVRAMLRGLSKTMLGYFEETVISAILEKLPLAKQKLHLLQALLSLILGLQEQFSLKHRILPILHNLIKHDDWNVRRVAIDIYYTIIVLKGMQEEDEQLLRDVEEAKYDKIKNVRDAAGNCLGVVRELGFGRDLEKEKEKESPKEKARTERPWSRTMSLTASNKPKQQPKSITIKNQSFFKNAKTDDIIITGGKKQQPPPGPPPTVFIQPKSPSAHSHEALGRKFTFQKQVARNNGDNDSLEQLAELIPSIEEPKDLREEAFEVEEVVEVVKQPWKENRAGIRKVEKNMNEEISIKEYQSGKKHKENQQPMVVGNTYKNDWIVGQLEKIVKAIADSQRNICNRVNILEMRMDKIQKRVTELQSRNGTVSPKATPKQSPPSSSSYSASRVRLYLTDQNQSSIVQSHIEQKIRSSLRQGKLSQAYGLVLANGKDDLLVWLLQQTGMVAQHLQAVHNEVLLRKLKELLSRRIEPVLCLAWVEEFLRAELPLSVGAVATVTAIVERFVPEGTEEGELLGRVGRELGRRVVVGTGYY